MKKLTLSKSNKMIGGVLGGFAEYIDVDSTVVRLGYVLITLFSCFAGILFYIIAWIIIPNKVSHVSAKASVKENETQYSGDKHKESEKDEHTENKPNVSHETNEEKETAKFRQEIPESVLTNKRLRKAFGIKLTPRRVEKQPGRNEKCPCGSGKKFKNCCGQ